MLCLFSKPFPKGLFVTLIGESSIVDYEAILDKTNQYAYRIGLIKTESNSYEQLKNAFLYLKRGVKIEHLSKGGNPLDLVETTIMDVPDVYSTTPSKLSHPCDIVIGSEQDVYYEVLPVCKIKISFYPAEKKLIK